MFWRKSKSEVGGIVGGNGLTDWWLDTFSEDERELICERNRQALLPQPAHDTIAHGPPLKVVGSLARFVSGWAAVGKLDHRSIDYRLIAKAEELLGSVTDVISRHFIFMHQAKIYYRWRDVDDFALEKAIEACRQQISIANEAATVFLDESSPGGLGFLPAHHGFKQLAIILEKDGNFEEALELCEQAKLQGWNGDWDARLTRLRKKLAKRGQS
jgi:tetratricopeptide (TPR) repeat protein